MAESTQRLSDPLKAKHAVVDWTSIGAFRNVLAHGYLGIDLERIWHIVENDVPPLRDAAAAILREVAD